MLSVSPWSCHQWGWFKGGHHRGTLTDVLLFRKILPKAAGLRLLLCHPITTNLKMLLPSPPLSDRNLKKYKGESIRPSHGGQCIPRPAALGSGSSGGE